MVQSGEGTANLDSGPESSAVMTNGDAQPAEQKQPRGPEKNLCLQYEQKVRPCIDLIDSLRALGVEQDLALPAIAVIGDQSSGKSSVLEALSGVALPRGSGIVTRCPLVLKLKKLPPESKWTGKVSYQDKEVDILEPAQVEQEINKAQDTIAGKGLGISAELINLEVSSPDVPDLTLIDLPGITRVAVGDQPTDIGCQIKALIRKYIQRQETINLVVVPSNVDIATTEALSMAQEVDPNGDRTIGILTKPDLVDRGTEDKVVDVVRNLVLPLKKGYLVVKCRCQQDIQEQLSLAQALQREQAFFEDHPHFRVLLEEGRATVPCLAERLSTELIEHICKTLPLLEQKIKENHDKCTEELQKYGVDIPEDSSERLVFLTAKINAFNQDITALVQGEEVVGEKDSRLFTKLRKEFSKWNSVIEDNFKEGNDEIRSQMQVFEDRLRGRELPGFVNFRTFETIVKQQIKALEEPALDMLHTVTVLVQKAFTAVSEKSFRGFSNLHKTTKAEIEDIRSEQEKKAEKAIRQNFQMEQVVYCQDKVYGGALRKVREKTEGKSYSPQERITIKSLEETTKAEMLEHLIAYYQEASTHISSYIPKVVQFFVLRTYGEQLQTAMLQLLQDKDACDWLLQERSDSSAKRRFLKERLSRLAQARRQLAKFPG
ncbi:interferon-induced GTP-binding protein Mx1-like [Ochotona curzoniae]|uniref:interferon-induced GTP-binding protein Mx1-like n=1 Tax=Ochotona curzoniae TaxID=130825 RepID=UPI001B34A7B1|nr:interferon-induced GTP-binding protein Mx1-like [Ochotona curzoniae]